MYLNGLQLYLDGLQLYLDGFQLETIKVDIGFGGYACTGPHVHELKPEWFPWKTGQCSSLMALPTAGQILTDSWPGFP